MTYFVGAIAKESAHNWDLCKEIKLFGISTGGRKVGASNIKKGDKLLVWLGGSGYIAVATVAGVPRNPVSREEAPWGGGLHRFGLVFPIKVDFEPNDPVWLGFKNGKQERTELPQFSIRKGFSSVPDAAGRAAEKIIRENPNGIKKPKPAGKLS